MIAAIKRNQEFMIVQFKNNQVKMINNKSVLFGVKCASQNRPWAWTNYAKYTSSSTYIQSQDGCFIYYPILAVDNGCTIAQRLDAPTFTPKRARFWSLHPGGANFAFCDGAVKFLAFSADSILPALATRAGGEVVSLPD